MKISFRTHPILEKIYQGSIETPKGILFFPSDKDYMESGAKNIFFNLWNTLIPEFRKEINHISESFLGALGENYESIMTLIDTRFESGIFNPSDPLNVVSGTFIIDDFVFTVQLEQKNQLVNGAVFGFTKDGIPMSFYVIIDNDITEWISNSCQSFLLPIL